MVLGCRHVIHRPNAGLRLDRRLGHWHNIEPEFKFPGNNIMYNIFNQLWFILTRILISFKSYTKNPSNQKVDLSEIQAQQHWYA